MRLVGTVALFVEQSKLFFTNFFSFNLDFRSGHLFYHIIINETSVHLYFLSSSAFDVSIYVSLKTHFLLFFSQKQNRKLN